MAAAWPGRVTLADLADRQLRRREAALALPPTPAGREPRLAGPGLRPVPGRRRGAPLLAGDRQGDPGPVRLARRGHDASPPGASIDAVLTRYRAALARRADAPSVPRDELRRRAAARRRLALDDVEDARSLARRFVVSAMSVGALSPEAHQALTIGIQRAGGAANTGEGGEDPAWYAPDADGRRRDARIKQVASARFGVTADVPRPGRPARDQDLAGLQAGRGRPAARAQGDRVHRGAATRPGRPVLHQPAAAPRHLLDRGPGPAHRRPAGHQPDGAGSASSSSPRAGSGRSPRASPRPARPTSTCPATPAGPAASPLSSIKHVGAPWELGLAEVHQVLLRNDLRDRVALRTDGGLQTGRDLLVAALLGAEEFAFGTGALVAVGCDMARQCHLDTCPTGIATQREDLRAKFTGTPEMVERYFLAVAEDLRRELARVGARSLGAIVGESRRLLRPVAAARAELEPVIGAAPWDAPTGPPGRSGARRPGPSRTRRPRRSRSASPPPSVTRARSRAVGLRLSTADRSFGAGLTGALERGELRGPVRLELRGSAGQSFGAFTGAGVELRLVGQANDYVGKGLSGGRVTIRPEPDLAVAPLGGGDRRQHRPVRRDRRAAPPRRAGRDALRGPQLRRRRPSSRAIGPHGCEYMTGGMVVVLGPGRGELRGRDDRRPRVPVRPERPPRRRARRGHVVATRLSTVLRRGTDGAERNAELRGLLEDHRDAGSAPGRAAPGRRRPAGRRSGSSSRSRAVGRGRRRRPPRRCRTVEPRPRARAEPAGVGSDRPASSAARRDRAANARSAWARWNRSWPARAAGSGRSSPVRARDGRRCARARAGVVRAHRRRFAAAAPRTAR